MTALGTAGSSDQTSRLPSEEGGRVRVTVRAVAVLYFYRAATGLLVSYPVARTVGALGATTLADGDREFFAPGGLKLLEALRLGVRIIPAALESASLAGVLVAIGSVFPFAVALADLLRPHGTLRERFGIAAERAPTLLVLGGATLLVQAVTVTLAVLAVTGAFSFTGSLRNERIADLIPAAVGVVGLLLSFAMGVVQDLARAATMRHTVSAVLALRIAVRTFREGAGAVLRAFVTPLLVAVVLLIAASALTTALDVSRPGTWRVVGVGLTHQLVILALVTLRLRALGTALMLTGPHGERPTQI